MASLLPVAGPVAVLSRLAGCSYLRNTETRKGQPKTRFGSHRTPETLTLTPR